MANRRRQITYNKPSKHKIKPSILAINAALSVLLAPSMALADHSCPSISFSMSNLSWTTGNCTIDSGVTVSGTTAPGVSTSATVGTLINNGTIASSGDGFLADRASVITAINNFGVVGGDTAFHIISATASSPPSGTIFALTNSGTISANGTDVKNDGLIGTLTNDVGGKLESQSSSAVIENESSGTINLLVNNGQILSGNTSPPYNASGIYNQGAIGTLTNAGTIETHGTEYAYGIQNSSGISTLTNSGTINANATTITAWGIYNSGHIGTIANSGIISGIAAEGAGIGIYNSSGTIDNLINSVAGTISGTANTSSVAYGVQNSGTIGTLANSGVITASSVGSISSGIYNEGTILNLTTGATGTISASSPSHTAHGIFNNGHIDALVNNGLITATSADKAYGLYNGSIVSTLTNTGTITAGGAGTLYAVFNTTGGSIDSFENSGLIQAPNAIRNEGGLLTSLTNSGTIAGSIYSDLDSELTINGGTGSTFGTITGVSGGITGGDIGHVQLIAADLNFGTGNILLNSDIDMGSRTVHNLGASLQLNNTVNITGNYEQSAAATLRIGINSGATRLGVFEDTGYGRLIVSGTANIEAGSSISFTKLGSYNYATGQRYLVIRAAEEGSNFNASALNYTATGYTGTIISQVVNADAKTNLVVCLGRCTGDEEVPPPDSGGGGGGGGGGEGGGGGGGSGGGSEPPAVKDIATIPNAVAAITGLTHYSGVDVPLMNLQNAMLAITTAGEANKVGEQLRAEPHGATTAAAMQPTLEVLNVVAAHSDNLRLAQAHGDTGIASGETQSGAALWGEGFGTWAHQGEKDNFDGFGANSKGMLLGSDAAISNNWRVGGILAYAITNVEDSGNRDGDKTDLNTYGLLGYGSYTADPWYMDISAGVFQHQYDTKRRVEFTGFSGIADGDHDGMQYVVKVDGGYPMAVGDRKYNMTLTPLGSLAYSKLNQERYSETGGNGAALSIDSSESISVKSELGVKLERGFTKAYGDVVPELRLVWRHEFDDDAKKSTASFAADTTGTSDFSTVGPKPMKDSAVISVGVNVVHSKDVTLSAKYETERAEDYVSQTARIRLRWLF